MDQNRSNRSPKNVSFTTSFAYENTRSPEGEDFNLPSKLGRNIEYAEQKVEVMDICHAVRNDVVHFKTIEHVDW